MDGVFDVNAESRVIVNDPYNLYISVVVGSDSVEIVVAIMKVAAMVAVEVEVGINV
jgi:hypothetical protein